MLFYLNILNLNYLNLLVFLFQFYVTYDELFATFESIMKCDKFSETHMNIKYFFSLNVI